VTIHDFSDKKAHRIPITMITSYDSWSASIIAECDIDCILVGDSLSMVMHGSRSTIEADPQLMALHVRAVRAGAPDAFIIGDMPFLSYRKGLKDAMECVELLMRAGSQAIKLEGVRGHEAIIAHIVGSGVPVMGHLGLTPQSVHQLGGYKVQGKGAQARQQLIEDAKALEDLGCFSLVLECVPHALASEIAQTLRIPVIGIGAGSEVDGQVLVLHDMLGLSPGPNPRFVKQYLEGRALMTEALNSYARETRDRQFPSSKEQYA
jgi:3-methyl-2-oxobutanoate hydroxymethyltransferase